MKKWNLNTIRNYIEGLDIEFDLEELENDVEFMMAVINYSNDYKMYSFCGDKIKYNYELIKFMIQKFNANTNYVIELANDYFDHTLTDEYLDDIPTIEYLEVLLTLDKYLPRSLEENIIMEKIRARNEYMRYRVSFEASLENDPEENSLGFDFIEYFYSGSVLIKDFFAYNMIDEIFSSHKIEKKLHETYKEKPNSSISVLIELLKCYDMELAYYVTARIKEFNTHLNEIDKMINRWDTYITNSRHEKANDVIDAIYKYYDEFGYAIASSVDQIITYFGNKYNILEEMKIADTYFMPAELDLKSKRFQERSLITQLDSIIRLILNDKYDPYVYANNYKKCEIKQYKIPINK